MWLRVLITGSQRGLHVRGAADDQQSLIYHTIAVHYGLEDTTLKAGCPTILFAVHVPILARTRECQGHTLLVALFAGRPHSEVHSRRSECGEHSFARHTNALAALYGQAQQVEY